MNYLPVYSRFIAGHNLRNAIIVSEKLKQKNIGTIFDYAVESSKNMPINISEIFKQIRDVNSGYIALKFSSLGIEDTKHCECLIDQFYKENLKKKNPNKFLIDAENYKIQNKINDLSNYAIDKYNTSDNKFFYKTLQMYRADSLRYFYDDTNNFIKENKYALKLVRGAYLEEDRKYNIIFNDKRNTDNQYNVLIKIYLEHLNNYSNNELLLATHNEESINLGIKLLKENEELNNQVYFATLLGMGDRLNVDYLNCNRLKYVPYGPFFETIPYLSRRLLENKEMIYHM